MSLPGRRFAWLCVGVVAVLVGVQVLIFVTPVPGVQWAVPIAAAQRPAATATAAAS